MGTRWCWSWTTASTCLPGVAELVAGLLRRDSAAFGCWRRAGSLSTWPANESVRSDRSTSRPPLATLEQIENSGSGALFLARLPMNVATRALNEDDLTAIGAICFRLDGIPLGLELAAARSRTMSLPGLSGLLDALDRSLDVARPWRPASAPHDARSTRLGIPVAVSTCAVGTPRDERVRRWLRIAGVRHGVPR